MEKFKKYITETPNFPKKGILFRDVSPLMLNKMSEVVDSLIGMYTNSELNEIDHITGIESRGFIFAAAMATALKKGFIMIRKQGKLPNPSVSEKYDLEYGQATLEMHAGKGRIMIVDDVIATSGTLTAAANLSVKAGYDVKQIAVLVDLNLAPNYEWEGIKCRSLIQY